MEQVRMLNTIVPKNKIGQDKTDPYVIVTKIYLKKENIIVVEEGYFSKEQQKESWYKCVEEYMNNTNTKPYILYFTENHRAANIMLTDEELSNLIS